VGGLETGGNETNSGVVSVAVAGDYAYVANWGVGLEVIDVRNPAHCILAGGYKTRFPRRVALLGDYAYVADDTAGLLVIDVSDPGNCTLVSGYNYGGSAYGVAPTATRVCIAAWGKGLLVLPSLSNILFTLRLNAAPGVSFTLEAATNLLDPNSWQPLLTTNVATMPFDFVDFDVKLSEKPQKFYRVRQP
jgi:hypothetical protein